MQVIVEKLNMTWKILQKSPSYFINVTNDMDYQILITDYIKIWSVYYTEDLFINCLNESNFGLEIDRQELLEKGTDILLKPKELSSVEICTKDSTLNVSLTMLFGYPLNIDLKLFQGSDELFFQKITQPLLKTIHDLKASENELRSLLIKKDEEIIEYKSQGGKIKYTALPPYKDNEHMSKHRFYELHFGSNDVPECILEKNTNHSTEPCVKHKPEEIMCIKSEPLSETSTTKPSNSRTVPETYTSETSVKTEFKPFVPKKKIKRLNI